MKTWNKLNANLDDCFNTCKSEVYSWCNAVSYDSQATSSYYPKGTCYMIEFDDNIDVVSGGKSGVVGDGVILKCDNIVQDSDDPSCQAL